MKSLKRIIIVIIIISVISLLYRFGLIGSASDLLGSPSETTTPPATHLPATPQPTAVTESAVVTDAPSLSLPEGDYGSMNLFTDGISEAILVDVLDGDTAVFKAGGKTYKTRFLAIDTPEVDPDLRDVEPWGSAASAFTKDKLRNARQIVLELDPDSDTFDKYDRLLAWIWVDGELLNEMIVSAGLAEVAYLYGDYQYTGFLFSAQNAAKAEGIKIWGELDPNFAY